MMAKKKFSCDFETTTDPQDCRIWAYGYMEIGKKENYKIGKSIDDFMVFVRESQAILYFHNLRFDGEFIVNWLLKNGYRHSDSGQPYTFNTIISNMGQWYMIDICYGYKGKKKQHTVIYDSLKKLPFPVKKIAKDFNLPIEKGDIDYHAYRPVGHKITPLEYAYIKNDIEIIADALKVQFDQGLEKMTNGSDSLHGFKSIFGSKVFDKTFPIFSIPMNEEMRKAYKGGFTWLNDKYKGKTVGEGMVFDVNSLYPSVMYNQLLPYGNPLPFHGKYEQDDQFPLYIQCFNCDFELKEGKIPMIQLKKSMMFQQNEYIKNSNGEYPELTLTNVDLEMFFDHYHVYDIQYHNGYKFRGKKGMFKMFIDKWTYVKTHEKGAKKLLAKLMLNSLYGKFATNPKVTGKVPYLKPDGSTGFALGDEEYRDPIYTPMGAFVTAWARHITISTAQKCYERIIYCDTDSIHLIGNEIPDVIKDIIDDNKLGYWAHESNFASAKYIRQKTYAQEIILSEPVSYREGNKRIETNKQFIVKCAGMPDKVKKYVNFDNFEVGFASKGKLLPKHVDGGVVLLDTVFTIK